MLPNETLQDETRPGSVRGEANGEGQPVARMPAVDHKQCSSPQQHQLVVMMHFILWYTTTLLVKKSPGRGVKKPHGKAIKRAQGPNPRTMDNLSTAMSASSLCLHACLRQCLTLCTPIGLFPSPLTAILGSPSQGNRWVWTRASQRPPTSAGACRVLTLAVGLATGRLPG